MTRPRSLRAALVQGARPLGSSGIALVLGLALVLPASAAGLDSDGDGLEDAFEARYGLTSPTDPDTDDDGVVDSAEDSDHDGLGDWGEQRSGTDPGDPDSDDDGILDGAEDHDGDGRANALEQDERAVPDGLRPALTEAGRDVNPQKQACMAEHRRSKVVFCQFGDSDGEVRIALAGDSHAAMYLTPLSEVAAEHGWQLWFMGKRACPAILGLTGENQWRIDQGRTCGLWQGRVISRLDRAPVDLLVLAQSPAYRLRMPDGAAVAPSEGIRHWRRGLRRTVAALPTETTVLVLGGTPRNFRGNPVKCLRQDPGDISACVTERQPVAARTTDRGLRQAASTTRARFDSLFDQVCTYDPCPIVQGDVLMWRNGSHLSETFARQLQPSIERILLDALDIQTEEP